MRNSITKIISTFFYAGYFPLAPGTFASICVIPIIWLLINHPLFYFCATCLAIMLGFLVSSKAEELFARKDSEYIVIDEVGGMFLSLLFLPINAVTIFCAFLLFRALDTVKIYPADRLQRLSGAKGIMLDDVVAGLYTNLILQLALRLA